MTEMREQFNFGAVVSLSGVHPRTLDFWGKSGFLEPSIQKATGTGSKRLYSFADIIAARIARRFRERGVDLRGLRRVVNYLQKSRRLKDPPLDVRLVVLDDDKVLIVRSDSELVKAFSRSGQAHDALVIDVGRTAEEVRRGLKEVAWPKPQTGSPGNVEGGRNRQHTGVQRPRHCCGPRREPAAASRRRARRAAAHCHLVRKNGSLKDPPADARSDRDGGILPSRPGGRRATQGLPAGRLSRRSGDRYRRRR